MADPGWYADGEDPTMARWWDGTGWTEATKPLVALQPPPAGPRLIEPTEPEPSVVEDIAQPRHPAPEVTVLNRDDLLRPAAPGPKFGKSVAWLIVIMFCAGIVGLIVNDASRDDAAGVDIAAPESTGPTVPAAEELMEYCWSGASPSVDITYTDFSGDTAQESGVDNNQCIKIGRRMPPDYFAYISVQNQGSGILECEIRIDGQAVEQTVSRGEYVIASCSGRF